MTNQNNSIGTDRIKLSAAKLILGIVIVMVIAICLHKKGHDRTKPQVYDIQGDYFIYTKSYNKIKNAQNFIYRVNKLVYDFMCERNITNYRLLYGIAHHNSQDFNVPKASITVGFLFGDKEVIEEFIAKYSNFNIVSDFKIKLYGTHNLTPEKSKEIITNAVSINILENDHTFIEAIYACVYSPVIDDKKSGLIYKTSKEWFNRLPGNLSHNKNR